MIIHWTWGYTQISDKATFGDPGWGFHHERGWPVFSIWESQGDLKHHGFLPGERVKTKLSEATQLGWETQAECCTSKRRCASLEGKADMDRWRAGLPCAWFVFWCPGPYGCAEDHGCLLNAVTGYTDASNQQLVPMGTGIIARGWRSFFGSQREKDI